MIDGVIRKELKKFIKGKIIRARGKNGQISISIPSIDVPRIVYGNSPEGIGRGQGKKGDVIGKGPKKGGNGAGEGSSEGIIVNLDLEEVLKFMQDELELPNLKKKPNEIYDEIKVKYTNISLIGPESLRHNRRTLMQTLKRQITEGTFDKLRHVPGLKDPVRVLMPIEDDKRYRQHKEIKLPSSNALIVFARDGSGSMDATKCEIINDMAWWIDVWIRRFYERVERLYVWHDTEAMEVDQEKFYKYRFGGGTKCSSALKFITKQFENRFPPDKWNVYVFYFTDGENWTDDNEIFIKCLQEEFTPEVVNFTGITQIFASPYEGSVKQQVDRVIKFGLLKEDCVRTVSIGSESDFQGSLTEEVRNEQIMNAIKKLLGNPGKVTMGIGGIGV